MKLIPLFLLIPALHAAPLSLDVVKNTAREIDELLLIGQKEQNVTPNPLTDDSTFLRRSYLNIAGRLPSHDEAASFLDSSSSDKRTDLIETLAGSTGMKSRLFNYWADLFRLQTNNETSGLGWHVWLRKAIEDNMPYDIMVNSMLSATGHAAENPAAGYYLRDRGMLLDNVSNTVEVFLGHQIGCAQCHDHPFDTFTQMDYYQLASFLGATEYKFDGAREKIEEVMEGKMSDRPDLSRMNPKQKKQALKDLKKKGSKKKGEARDIASLFRYHNRNAISENHKKGLKLPEDYQYEDGVPGEVIPPQTIFGEKFKNIAPEDRRQVFADWVTSQKNPYFTKVIANRLWAYAFGDGVVPEMDNWSNSPDPLYPELMAILEKAMIATDYDVAQFLRILYHTQLFQRQVSLDEPTQGTPFDFSGPSLRRMSAEELRDSFITLGAGVVDENINEGFETAWSEYTESYDFLMGATPAQIRELNKVTDDAEVARRKAQAEASKIRTAMRLAKEKGNMAEVRRLNLKATQMKKEVGKKYARKSMQNEVVQKASAAISRRGPKAKATHSQFQLRSSELPSPERGNSLAREFGASDRETPSAGHTQSTVPQVLRLLNGNETSMLTSKKNKFARGLTNLSTPEERLDYLFLSLYSAKPTASEKEAFLPEVKTIESTTGFARAMLTSNRFLFVQ